MPPKQRSSASRSAAAAAFKPPSNYLSDEAVYGSENYSTLPYAYNCASASADHESLNTVTKLTIFLLSMALTLLKIRMLILVKVQNTQTNVLLNGSLTMMLPWSRKKEL